MAEFKIPELGENVSAGEVVRILVKAGDALKKDQPVLELETDKATIEVPSNVDGTVREVKVKKGEKVKVGQLVLTLDEGGAAEAAPKEDEAPSKPKSQPTAAPEEGGLSQKASADPQPAAGGAARLVGGLELLLAFVEQDGLGLALARRREQDAAVG